MKREAAYQFSAEDMMNSILQYAQEYAEENEHLGRMLAKITKSIEELEDSKAANEFHEELMKLGQMMTLTMLGEGFRRYIQTHGIYHPQLSDHELRRKWATLRCLGAGWKATNGTGYIVYTNPRNENHEIEIPMRAVTEDEIELLDRAFYLFELYDIQQSNDVAARAATERYAKENDISLDHQTVRAKVASRPLHKNPKHFR